MLQQLLVLAEIALLLHSPLPLHPPPNDSSSSFSADREAWNWDRVEDMINCDVLRNSGAFLEDEQQPRSRIPVTCPTLCHALPLNSPIIVLAFLYLRT